MYMYIVRHGTRPIHISVIQCSVRCVWCAQQGMRLDMFRIHCHHSNNIMLCYVGLGMASLCIISCMHARMHVCAHLHYMYMYICGSILA